MVLAQLVAEGLFPMLVALFPGQQCESQSVRSNALTGKAARIEKLPFLRRSLASEQRVAVWEATESRNDVVMDVRMARRVSAKLSIESQCAILIFDALRMNEWRVKKKAKRRLCRDVEAAGNGLFCDIERLIVGCEHAWRTAKTIARILIKQDQERQRAIAVSRPVIQFATGRRLMRRGEFFTKAVIERFVFSEPAA